MTKEQFFILRHQRGFTLVEIMVTLGVLAIVAALVSPAVMSMAPSMRLRTATNELHADLMRAKSRAVKDNREVGFSVTTVACPAATEFAPTINGGAYRIFVDDGGGNVALSRNKIWNLIEPDADADGVLDAAEDLNGNGVRDEQILSEINDTPGDGIDDLPDRVAICSTTLPATINFTPTGLIKDANQGNLELKISTVAGETFYRITLSPAGNVNLEQMKNP